MFDATVRLVAVSGAALMIFVPSALADACQTPESPEAPNSCSMLAGSSQGVEGGIDGRVYAANDTQDWFLLHLPADSPVSDGATTALAPRSLRYADNGAPGFGAGDGLYYQASNGSVEPLDLRLTASGGHAAGTYVAASDSDAGSSTKGLPGSGANPYKYYDRTGDGWSADDVLFWDTFTSDQVGPLDIYISRDGARGAGSIVTSSDALNGQPLMPLAVASRLSFEDADATGALSFSDTLAFDLDSDGVLGRSDLVFSGSDFGSVLIHEVQVSLGVRQNTIPGTAAVELDVWELDGSFACTADASSGSAARTRNVEISTSSAGGTLVTFEPLATGYYGIGVRLNAGPPAAQADPARLDNRHCEFAGCMAYQLLEAVRKTAEDAGLELPETPEELAAPDSSLERDTCHSLSPPPPPPPPAPPVAPPAPPPATPDGSATPGLSGLATIAAAMLAGLLWRRRG